MKTNTQEQENKKVEADDDRTTPEKDTLDWGRDRGGGGGGNVVFKAGFEINHLILKHFYQDCCS